MKAVVLVVPSEDCIPFSGSQQCIEGLEGDCTVRDKPMIEIYHPEEFLEFALGGGLREVLHSLDFVYQWADAFACDIMSQEVQLCMELQTHTLLDTLIRKPCLSSCCSTNRRWWRCSSGDGSKSSMPQSTLSINLWKVCATLHSLNVNS